MRKSFLLFSAIALSWVVEADVAAAAPAVSEHPAATAAQPCKASRPPAGRRWRTLPPRVCRRG